MGVSGGWALPSHGGFIPKDPVDGRGEKPGSHGASAKPSVCQQHGRAEAAPVLGRWGVRAGRAPPVRAVYVSPLIEKRMVSRKARQDYSISTKSTRRELLQDCLYGKTYNRCSSNLTNRIKKTNTLHKK